MHVTRGSTQHRYTEIPRPPLQPKTKLLDVRARSSRPRAIMQTRRGAQKRGRDSGVQAGPPRAGDPAVGAQVETLAGDEHISDAHAQAAEDESIAPSAGSEGGSASESAQPISGIAPRDTHDDERPSAAPPAQQPTPVGRLIRVFTPYGDLDGTIDPSGAGAWHNIWDDTPQPGQRGYQPGSSSNSSEWPSSALKRSMFCNPSGPPPAATTTPAEPSHGMSGQLVPFGEQQQSRLHPTRSDSSVSMPLSTLTRLRAYAEAKGEYDAADNDTYPAQLTNSFLDEVNVKAIDAAKAYREKAEAEGRVLTAQQQRRDGRTAAKTAFRSLRWLLDNVKMATAADDALVCKRKFGTTTSIPTPALEPPHYAQLCYLATHHHSRVVRGTAAGFALVASQTSRFKQAQACAILAEKNGVLYTCVQVDKSNEPHKQSPRPAFGPIFDAYGSRGVIDAVYDALRDVEAGCFLVRDNDSASGAPVEGCLPEPSRPGCCAVLGLR